MSPQQRAANGSTHVRGRPWFAAWLGDTAVLLLSQAMLTATATLVMILIARGLSTYQFGVFSSFLGFSQAISFVIDTGMPAWILRENARDLDGGDQGVRRIANRLWSSVYTIATIGAVLSVIVALGSLALGLPPTLALAQAGFVVYITLLAVGVSLDSDLRSRRRRGQVIVATMLEKGVLLALVGAALILHLGVLGIAVAHIIGGSAHVVFSYTRTLGGMSEKRPPWSRQAFSVIRASAPFAAYTAATVFFPRVDTPIVALVGSVVMASYYALGFQIVTTALVVAAVANSTLIPFFSRHISVRMQVRHVLVMTSFGLLIAVIGYFLAPSVVPLLFGDKFRAAVPTVRVMLAGCPFAFLTASLSITLIILSAENVIARTIWLPGIAGSVLVALGAHFGHSTEAAAGFTARYALQSLRLVFVARNLSRQGALQRVPPSDIEEQSTSTEADHAGGEPLEEPPITTT